VLHRSFSAVIVAVLVVATAACGGKEAGPADTGVSSPEAALLVTQGCGNRVVIELKEVAAQQTAMRALDRVADIETDSGGKFVTAINGIEQNSEKKLAWLYYINGKAAQKGAAEIKLASGDVEWWDLHDYEHECTSVPAEAQ
jgi:uncharacterized protein DUF4430